uniref:HAT C-terminal dimerisation domain-containing protein n=1 Tax=Poecilia formosa TaxID=48698 RepID=A0A096MHE8_POEFO
FIFLVNMQTKILECINAASQLLQAKDTDILKAFDLLVLMEFRKKFDEVKSATLALAAKWGSQTQFETTRARKVKRHFDELSEDCRLTDAESNFRAVQPNTLLQAGDEELYQAAQRLSEHYRRDIAPSSPAQLLCRTSFRDQIAKQKSVVDLAKMLIVSHPAVTFTFTEVCAFLLFLTLPVSVASSERSFSKLKIIKNYLRSTMGQERLSGLAILSIENERAKKMDDFAERKTRCMPFK